MAFLTSSPLKLVVITNLIFSLSLTQFLSPMNYYNPSQLHRSKPHNKIIMKPIQPIHNIDKISKVISISSNYKYHRQNIGTIKPAIDFNDHKHMDKFLKLTKEKDQYTHNVRNLKISELKKENHQLLRRLTGVKSHVRKEISPSQIKQQHKTIERSPSRQSVTSASSQKSCASNFRRRTMRQLEIDRQNKKIAARIMNPKMSKDLNYLKMCKFYEKQQNYSRIRSRFSDRSQSIMQSLALDDLKLQKKYVQFLPQLSSKRLDKTAIRYRSPSLADQSTKKTLPLTHRPTNKQ